MAPCLIFALACMSHITMPYGYTGVVHLLDLCVDCRPVPLFATG